VKRTALAKRLGNVKVERCVIFYTRTKEKNSVNTTTVSVTFLIKEQN